MTFLIIPGFAKSGTTYLRNALKKNLRFRVSAREELKYFVQKDDPSLDDYLTYFRATPKEISDRWGEVVLEASPPYLSHTDDKIFQTSLAQMKDTLPDPYFVVCLRHPAKRAFSYYRHLIDVYACYGAGRRLPSQDRGRVYKRPYRGSFADMLGEDRCLTLSLSQRIEGLIETFGKDRVMLSFLETDGRDFSGFYPRLCSFLNIEDDGFRGNPDDLSDRARNASEGFPTYYYGGEDGLYIIDDIALKPREFLVVTARAEEIHRNVKPEQAKAAFAARRTWTRNLDAKEFSDIHARFFRAEGERIAEMVARYFPELDNVPDYTSDPGPGTTRPLKDLLPRGHARDVTISHPKQTAR